MEKLNKYWIASTFYANVRNVFKWDDIKMSQRSEKDPVKSFNVKTELLW